MVDREARDKLTECLRHFLAGLTTNHEYDEVWMDIRSKDDGVFAVMQQSWMLYDDFKKHKLTGDWAITPETRRQLVQAILFLQTDNEYEWPLSTPTSSGCYIFLLICILSVTLFITSPHLGVLGPFIASTIVITFVFMLALHILSLFINPLRKLLGALLSPLTQLVHSIDEPRYDKALGPLAGKKDLWPFVRESDLEEARRHPRFLCGKS